MHLGWWMSANYMISDKQNKSLGLSETFFESKKRLISAFNYLII